MIRCVCGLCIDDDVGRVTCPRCGKQIPSESQAAHIPDWGEGEPASNERYMNRCPECSAGLVRAEGCCHCPVCGFGQCG